MKTSRCLLLYVEKHLNDKVTDLRIDFCYFYDGDDHDYDYDYGGNDDVASEHQ